MLNFLERLGITEQISQCPYFLLIRLDLCKMFTRAQLDIKVYFQREPVYFLKKPNKSSESVSYRNKNIYIYFL